MKTNEKLSGAHGGSRTTQQDNTKELSDALTSPKYIDDYQQYKAKLETSHPSIPVDQFNEILMIADQIRQSNKKITISGIAKNSSLSRNCVRTRAQSLEKLNYLKIKRPKNGKKVRVLYIDGQLVTTDHQIEISRRIRKTFVDIENKIDVNFLSDIAKDRFRKIKNCLETDSADLRIYSDYNELIKELNIFQRVPYLPIFYGTIPNTIEITASGNLVILAIKSQ